MKTSIALLCIFGALNVAYAQFLEKIILEQPIPELCAQRIIHERTSDGKGYFFSWREPALKGVEADWLGARNYCRKRCMDTVSLETKSENEWVKEKMVKDKAKDCWTSGRLCDYKGCERADLQPIEINGWFWTGSLKKLAPTNMRELNDWSEKGAIGVPQPDNLTGKLGGAPESCLAIYNELYKDGVRWHDVVCDERKPFVCEENESLLNFAHNLKPGLNFRP